MEWESSVNFHVQDNRYYFHESNNWSQTIITNNSRTTQVRFESHRRSHQSQEHQSRSHSNQRRNRKAQKYKRSNNHRREKAPFRWVDPDHPNREETGRSVTSNGSAARHSATISNDNNSWQSGVRSRITYDANGLCEYWTKGVSGWETAPHWSTAHAGAGVAGEASKHRFADAKGSKTHASFRRVSRGMSTSHTQVSDVGQSTHVRSLTASSNSSKCQNQSKGQLPKSDKAITQRQISVEKAHSEANQTIKAAILISRAQQSVEQAKKVTNNIVQATVAKEMKTPQEILTNKTNSESIVPSKRKVKPHEKKQNPCVNLNVEPAKIEIQPNSNPLLCNNGRKVTKCAACNVAVRNIVDHYVQKHSDLEVYHARMTPKMTDLVKNCSDVSVAVRSPNAIAAFCPFCETCRSYQNTEGWFLHISEHTGEYSGNCESCQAKQAGRGAKSMRCKGCTEELMRSVLQVDLHLNIFICGFCNFAQLKEQNMLNHWWNTHCGQKNDNGCFKIVAIIRDVSLPTPDMSEVAHPPDGIAVRTKRSEPLQGREGDLRLAAEEPLPKCQIIESNTVADEVMDTDSVDRKIVVKTEPIDEDDDMIGRAGKTRISTKNLSMCIDKRQATFTCFAEEKKVECSFQTEELNSFLLHLRGHSKTWNGFCNDCRKFVSSARKSLLSEFLHLKDFHLIHQGLDFNMTRNLGNLRRRTVLMSGLCILRIFLFRSPPVDAFGS